MRLKSVLVSIISVVIIAITGILLYVYWPAITGTINNSQYLTPEQGQELYDKGYEDGNKAEEEQLAQIAYYKQLTDDYYIQVGLLNNEISQLNGSIASKNETITELTNIKNTNLQTISDLNDIISANETTISNLNIQITGLQTDKINLQSQVTGLTSDIENKQVIITGLNTQVAELQSDISTKRALISELNNEIDSLEVELVALRSQSTSDEAQISSLTAQVNSLTNEVAILNSTITTKNSEISALERQIADLNNEVDDLENQLSSTGNSINLLNNQIVGLQILNTQLTQSNQSNIATISTLAAQINSLNNQISTLSLQIQNNSSNVTTLNNRISELETSIAYYESFIAGLQSESQVVATFMYDGSVYNIQVLNKNSYASVTAPTSTTYKIFNGWTVNGQSVDLANYSVSANTTFVADVTYKYDVQFMVDDQVINSQIVTSGAYATTPSAPTKANYQFDGWTINDLIVTPNTYVITENTTFIAKFTRLYTVTFTYESTTLDTQTVRSGEYATNVAVNDTTYKIFNGWKLNNVITNVGNVSIVSDTEFIADITYYYDVLFSVDGTTVDSQVIISNGYAILPSEPTKENYVFAGWSIDGNSAVDVLTFEITHNTTFVAKFNKILNWTFTVDGTVIDSGTVIEGERKNISFDVPSYEMKLITKVEAKIGGITRQSWTFTSPTVPPAPVRTINYTFNPATADVEFVATCKTFHSVRLYVQNQLWKTLKVEHNKPATLPNVTDVENYICLGWATNSNATSATINVNGNTPYINNDSYRYYAVLREVFTYKIIKYSADSKTTVVSALAGSLNRNGNSGQKLSNFYDFNTNQQKTTTSQIQSVRALLNENGTSGGTVSYRVYVNGVLMLYDDVINMLINSTNFPNHTIIISNNPEIYTGA